MQKKYSFIIFLILFLLSVGLIWQGIKQTSFEWETLQPKQINSPLPSVGSNVLGVEEASNAAKINNLVQVIKVVDGDTIEVLIDGQKKTIRLIGINTPETVDPRRPVQCYGKEASDETKKLLTGKSVYLSKDVSETDKYDRLLRFVYLPIENGQMLFVNDYLVRQGFANNYPYPPDVKYDDQFRQAEKEAREQKKGLWSACF
jgi:endonuclease YncB( thermonuclease family)